MEQTNMGSESGKKPFSDKNYLQTFLRFLKRPFKAVMTINLIYYKLDVE